MIDAAVMADVKQQCRRRDGGFDLGKVFSECARSLARGDIGKGRQQSPNNAALGGFFSLRRSLPLAVFFHVG